MTISLPDSEEALNSTVIRIQHCGFLRNFGFYAHVFIPMFFQWQQQNSGLLRLSCKPHRLSEIGPQTNVLTTLADHHTMYSNGVK
jgi:hypothetical protein